MPRTIQSTRGGKKLVDDLNYTYEKHRTNADGSKIYWRCDVKSCSARLHTSTEENDYKVLNRIAEHQHSSCETKPKVCEALTKLKSTALSSQETSRSLIATTSTSLSENERAQLPSVSSLSRNFRK